jgi:putative phosphoesterase
MRIAVVSDTHGHVAHTNAAVRLIRQEKDVQAVLHCGDIGSPAIVPLFADWPTHFVFGNVDYDADLLADAIRAAGQTCHDRFGSIRLGDVQIALLHSDDRNQFDEAVESGEFDLVCYGHTHVAEQHHHGRTLILNPGALYRATPHTFALVELPGLEVRHLAVS